MTKTEDDKKYLREMRESDLAEKQIFELKLQIIRDELQKSLIPQIQAKNDRIRRNRERQKEFSKNY